MTQPTTNKFNTFWNIVKTIGIEIPAIQRDYAQGRGVGKIPKIRKKFINVLITSLINGTPLRLDFVYGKIYGEKNEEEIRKNTSAIKSLLNSIKDYADSIDLKISELEVVSKSNNTGESIFLIPLDGQQRLTALFLLHWYVIAQLGKFEDYSILRRFRYKTRKTTELFIEMLCDEKTKLNLKDRVSVDIINHEKFSNTWLDDPTVKSMLVVLDEIQKCFQEKLNVNALNVNFNLIYDNLITNEILFFDFLNLKNFGLSDDLYVKMNARGKELTDFENFKAWLLGKIENEAWLEKEQWGIYSSKFDVQWNDLFWHHKAEGIYEIDKTYFNYFKRVYLIDLVLGAKLSGSAFLEDDNKKTIDNIIENKVDFDFENIYGEKFKSKLSNYFSILNFCSENKFSFHEYDKQFESFQDFWFNGRGKINWLDLVKNYIILGFIEINLERIDDKDLFIHYYRVLLNLYNNQTFDSAQLYKNALKSIRNINVYLKENNCNIYQWLSSVDVENNNLVFTKDQIAEEIIKGRLISSELDYEAEDSWYQLLKKAEANSSFKGKIGFLLELSENEKVSFLTHFTKIAPLFRLEILNDEEHVFQRVLLTYGNYFDKKPGNKFYFFKNDRSSYRARRENWLGLLVDTLKNKSILALIKNPYYNENDVKHSLNIILNEYLQKHPIDILLEQPISKVEFYKLYIYCKYLFEYGESNLIQIAYGKYGYQLNKSNTGGYFNDLMSEFIKFHYFKNIDNLKIHRVTGWDNSPSITLENERLRLDPKKDLFILEMENTGDIIKTFYTLSDVIKYYREKLVAL